MPEAIGNTNESKPIEETLKKIDGVVESQAPAIEESEWADSPDLEVTAAQQKELADAAKKSSAEAQFDDTSHEDGEARPQRPVPRRREPVEQITADDQVPAGESVTPSEAKEGDQVPSLILLWLPPLAWRQSKRPRSNSVRRKHWRTR